MGGLLHRRRGQLALLGVLAAIFLFFSFLVGAPFRTADNFETIARQTAITGFGAIGMTLIIISGAIDLSVGAAVALITVVIAWLLEYKIDPGIAAMGGVACGMTCGYLNGLFVTKFRVSAFIVTLAGFLIYRGLAKGLAGEQKIDVPLTWLTELMSKLGAGQKWMLLPIGVWLLIVLAIVSTLILERTVFGRNVVAIGASEQAARLCGIDPGKVRRRVFLYAGMCFGLAGLMQFSRLTVGDPTVAQGLELEVIAAAVIGGASLSGGEGSIFGALLGALIMSTIRAGCSQYGLPNWLQEIVTGVIILCAVWIDRTRQSRGESFTT